MLIDTLYANAANSRPHLACHELRHTCGGIPRNSPALNLKIMTCAE
jgi:hypothetical protein